MCVCVCVALGCSGSISLCISKKLVSRRSERSRLAPCCKLPCDFDSCTFISDHLYHLSDVNCVRLRPTWGNYGPWARYGPPPLVQGLVKMMSMVTDNKCAKFSFVVYIFIIFRQNTLHPTITKVACRSNFKPHSGP